MNTVAAPTLLVAIPGTAPRQSSSGVTIKGDLAYPHREKGINIRIYTMFYIKALKLRRYSFVPSNILNEALPGGKW